MAAFAAEWNDPDSSIHRGIGSIRTVAFSAYVAATAMTSALGHSTPSGANRSAARIPSSYPYTPAPAITTRVTGEMSEC